MVWVIYEAGKTLKGRKGGVGKDKEGGMGNARTQRISARTGSSRNNEKKKWPYEY